MSTNECRRDADFSVGTPAYRSDTPDSCTVPIQPGAASRELAWLDAPGRPPAAATGTGVPAKDTGAPASGAHKSARGETETLGRFDALTAAEVLEKFAQLTLDRFASNAVLEAACEPILVAGALLLRDAKQWLDQHLTPYDCFAGDAVLDAHATESAVHVENFVSALRSTAIELIQVRKLLEYRMHSTRRPWI